MVSFSQYLFLCATLSVQEAVVFSLSITFPEKDSVLDFSRSNTATILWTTVSTDPRTANLVLVNYLANPAFRIYLAHNVRVNEEQYIIEKNSTIKAGPNYQVQFQMLAENDILAQSGTFSIANAAASSSPLFPITNSQTSTRARTETPPHQATESSPLSGDSNGLSKGSKAGIGVSAALGAMAIAGVAIFLYRNLQWVGSGRDRGEDGAHFEKAELPAEDKGVRPVVTHELDASSEQPRGKGVENGGNSEPSGSTPAELPTRR